MIYLLDTNICIYILNRRPGYEQIVEQIDGRAYSEICISAITLAELEYGIAKSVKKVSNQVKLEYFLHQFESLPFNDQASATYGKLRVTLEAKGNPISPLDTLIASHAFSLNATVVTNNTREFARVEELRIENWLNPQR